MLQREEAFIGSAILDQLPVFGESPLGRVTAPLRFGVRAVGFVTHPFRAAAERHASIMLNLLRMGALKTEGKRPFGPARIGEACQ